MHMLTINYTKYGKHFLKICKMPSGEPCTIEFKNMAKILITIVSYNKKDRYKTKKDAMEISCKKMCIILSALIINQQIFCMELISCAKQCVVKRLYDETEFGKFSQLPLDTQRTIFKH